MPWDQALSARPRSASVARHLRKARGSDVWQTDGGAAGSEAGAGEDVVDAEFSEVDDSDSKRG